MKLNEYLKLHNLTQAEFAEKLDRSQTLVSAYCSGTLLPPRATALKIVKLTNFDVTLSDLWGVKIA